RLSCLERREVTAMEQVGNYLMTYIELGGLFAPVLFISFHLIRPLFFLPVVFICISGGVLFGTVAGRIYSLICISLSSVAFLCFYLYFRRGIIWNSVGDYLFTYRHHFINRCFLWYYSLDAENT